MYITIIIALVIFVKYNNSSSYCFLYGKIVNTYNLNKKNKPRVQLTSKFISRTLALGIHNDITSEMYIKIKYFIIIKTKINQ